MQRQANLDLAIHFLRESIDSKTGGSSAFYSRFFYPLAKWSPPYPETTGYIIPTLLDVSKQFAHLKNTEADALKMADWVVKLQDEEGALPAGFFKGENNENKSIFNSAQMIIGLIAAYQHTSNKVYLTAAHKAGKWMAASQQSDGSWDKHSFFKDFFPSYYTRVAWPMIMAGQESNDQTIIDAGRKCLDLIAAKQQKNLFIKDSGFKPNTYAFLHTIAYTIRGFIESGLLLNDERYWQIGYDLAHKYLRKYEIKKKFAGAYYEDFKEVTWYRCLTGEAQMAIIWLKIFEKTNDARFVSASSKLLDDVCKTQPTKTSLFLKKGGIKGSHPYYGTYLILRQPNWASKFFADALLLEEKAYQTVNNKMSQ